MLETPDVGEGFAASQDTSVGQQLIDPVNPFLRITSAALKD
jgi:hypothetical protein